ncbi:selenite/tellurite reduction operon b-type cytochrome iron-sulfur cluster-binding subunit ExtO [Citrifermentans bremense]|uniref:selenite/tellurite reduction operon b-type cytochrome iron-sulfur cluster-binding subunit ExtO n=1 Tax=Citrifermentans bremense TaxID=60035 RepID=UPI000479DDF8|nr:selenite/tellurite reduction operon b-type cytochrome iron-sulfur cluster-binding subunit ExtO [Citrifermentans bremense]
MRSMMLCIVACFLLLSAAAGEARENCTDCHKIAVSGVHAGVPCLSCHLSESDTLRDPASASGRAAGCVGCHKGYQALFGRPMATRVRETGFVARSFGRMDGEFFGKNCNSCHLQGCTDCHGGKGHEIAKPRDRDCFTCHKGYFVGTDYYGMAPREDSLRYQRGDTAYGEPFLKMTPDLHAEAGLTCADCHSMASLVAGRSSSKGCRDCHKPKLSVVEHRIAAHLEKMECWACHSAWAAQEYGTFYLRFSGSPSKDLYRVRRDLSAEEYVKSAYLRKQDAPPLGLNGRGKVSPIRPQFIGYFTDIRQDRAIWEENRLLAAEWKAFFPHTVRRGTVMCEGCHDNPRRFLFEPAADRIYQLQADGMTLPSFWDQSGQKVVNGSFLPAARYRELSKKTTAYRRAYLERWQKLIDHVEASSPR